MRLLEQRGELVGAMGETGAGVSGEDNELIRVISMWILYFCRGFLPALLVVRSVSVWLRRTIFFFRGVEPCDCGTPGLTEKKPENGSTTRWGGMGNRCRAIIVRHIHMKVRTTEDEGCSHSVVPLCCLPQIMYFSTLWIPLF